VLEKQGKSGFRSENMGNEPIVRIAILYPGDYETRQSATVENNRFAQLFQALADLSVDAQPAVYHPDFWQEVSQQLLQVDGVLVWVNPIQDGHDRAVLDSMLKDITDKGIFVSAQPDIILKMGTKEVLYQTRHMGWGCDTHLLNSLEQMRQELPVRLAAGAARVLKQYRGNGGSGVWKVELAEQPATDTGVANPDLGALVQVRHAQRGSTGETMPLDDFLSIWEEYFSDLVCILDMSYEL
jgi:hypothetical protein